MPLRFVVALMLMFTAGAADAQQSVRVSGTVTSFDGHVLALRSSRYGDVKVNVPDDLVVFGVTKASLADIKQGSFIGVGAMPQPDGSQRALQVTVFAESQRGLGEGHRPWSREPGATMTNATVGRKVDSKDGETLMVTYKGGTQKIVVPPEATILAYQVGDKDELKPGAHVAITRAIPQPDGSLSVGRVNVGRGGVVPQ